MRQKEGQNTFQCVSPQWQKRGKIMVQIENENLKRLVIKAEYADVQATRAVYNRDCQIRARIHHALEDVYDILDDFEESHDVPPENPNPTVDEMLYYVVCDLVRKLEREGLAHRD